MDSDNRLAGYLRLGLLSFLIAAVLRGAIEYFGTGKLVFAADDRLFPVLWASFFVLSIVFRSLASRFLRCSECGNVSQDILIFSEGPSVRLCREHLVERFKHEFTACTEKMVVVYPALETKRGPYVYEYTAVDDLPPKFLQSPFGLMITAALSSIGGKCGRCSRNATVAYFGPGNTPWESAATGAKGWDEVHREGLPASFQITCPYCIADEVCFSLRQFKGVFSEGVFLPHKGDGIFMSRLG